MAVPECPLQVYFFNSSEVVVTVTVTERMQWFLPISKITNAPQEVFTSKKKPNLVVNKTIVLTLILVLFQEATPMRIKSVHFLNTPPFFETFFNFFKRFFTEKTKSRVSLKSYYSYCQRKLDIGSNIGRYFVCRGLKLLSKILCLR